MQWPRLVGKRRKQPSAGQWHEWKQTIADHCGGRCIYCAISEGRFGGIRNFHVEHFRPKVKFPTLESDIRNLYLACAICNVLKSDDWPADPANDHSIAAYPDPSIADYNALLTISSANHEVIAGTVAGKYLIERVLLNRAQLIVERRLSAMLQFLAKFDAWITSSIGTMTAAEMKATISVLQSVNHARTSAFQARPYRDADTKRQVRAKAKRKRSRS